MIGEERGSKEQNESTAEQRRSQRGVEQQPINQYRQSHDGRERGVRSECMHGDKAERKNGGKEQCNNAKDMHRAIQGIAMVFDVIRKLTFEKAIHVMGSLWFSRGNFAKCRRMKD